MSDHLYTSNPSPTLPREILKWLQTLKLSYPIKIPRRDLATGFTVAEICATYWTDVPMHSFANGLSAANKESNWHLLRKIFLANGLVFKNPKSISPFQHTSEAAMAAVRKNMSKEESDFDDLLTGVMNAEGNNAHDLLQLLYTVFTGKVAQQPTSVTGNGELTDPNLPPSLSKPPPFVKNVGGAAIPTSLSQRNEEAQAAAAAAILASQMDNAQLADNERRRRELLGTDEPADSPSKKNQNAATSGPRTVAKLVRRQAEAIKAIPADAEEEGPAVQFSSVTVRPLPAALMARFSGHNVAESSSTGASNAAQKSTGKNAKGALMTADEASRSDTDACVFLSGLVDTILTRDLQIDPFSSAHGASPWVLDTTTPTLFDYILRHSQVQAPPSSSSGTSPSASTQSVVIPATTTIVGLVWERLIVDHLTAISDFFLAHPQQIGVLARAMLAVKASNAFQARRPSSAPTVRPSTGSPQTQIKNAPPLSDSAVGTQTGVSPTSPIDAPTLQNADLTLGLLDGGHSNGSSLNTLNATPANAAERITKTSDLLVLLYGYTNDASWVPDTSLSEGGVALKKRDNSTQSPVFTSEAIASIRADLLRLLLHTIPHHTFIAIIISTMLKTSTGKTAALYRSYFLPAVVESLFCSNNANGTGDGSTTKQKSDSTNQDLSGVGGDLSSGGRRNGPFYVAPPPTSVSPTLSTKSSGRLVAEKAASTTTAQKLVDVNTTASAPQDADTTGHDSYTAKVAAALRVNASFDKLTVVAWLSSLFSFGADLVDPAIVLPGINFPLVATATSASEANDIASLVAANNASSNPITIDSTTEVALKRLQAAHRKRVHNDIQGFSAREAGNGRVLALCSALLASVGLTESTSAAYLTVTTQLIELLLLKAKASEALIPLTRAAIKASTTRKSELLSTHNQRALLLQYQQVASNSGPNSGRVMNMQGGGGFTVENVVGNTANKFGGGIARPPVGVLKKNTDAFGATAIGAAHNNTSMMLRPSATISITSPTTGNNAANNNSAAPTINVTQQQTPPTVFGLGGLFNVAQSLLYCRPVQTTVLSFLLYNVSAVLKAGVVTCVGVSNASASVVAALSQLRLLLHLTPMALISAATLAVPSQLAELLKNIDSFVAPEVPSTTTGAVTTGEFVKVLKIASETESLFISLVLNPLMGTAGNFHTTVPQWLAAIDAFTAALQASATTAIALSQRVLPSIHVENDAVAKVSFPPFFTTGKHRQALVKAFMYLSSPTFLSAPAVSPASVPPVAPQPVQAYAAFTLSRLLPVAVLPLNFFDSTASSVGSAATVEDTAFTLFEALEYFDKKNPKCQVFGPSASAIGAATVYPTPIYTGPAPARPTFIAGANALYSSGVATSLCGGGGPALSLLSDLLVPIKTNNTNAGTTSQNGALSPTSPSAGNLQQQLQAMNGSNATANGANNNGNHQQYLTAGAAEQATVGLTEPSILESLAPLLYLCEAVARKARGLAASTNTPATTVPSSAQAPTATSVLLSVTSSNAASTNAAQSSVNLFSGTATATAGTANNNSSVPLNRRGSVSSANRQHITATAASSNIAATSSTLGPNNGVSTAQTQQAPNFISPQTYIKDMLPTPSDAAFVITWAHKLLVQQQVAASGHYNFGAVVNKTTAAQLSSPDSASPFGLDANSPLSSGNALATTHALSRLVATKAWAAGGVTTPLAAATAAFLATFEILASGKRGDEEVSSQLANLQTAPPMERWWSLMRTIIVPCANFFLQSEAVIVSTTKHLQQQQQRDSTATISTDDGDDKATKAAPPITTDPNATSTKRDAHSAEVRAYSALAKQVIVQLYKDHSAQHASQQLALANERVIECSTQGAHGVVAAGGPTLAPPTASVTETPELLIKSLRWWTVAVASK